MSDHDQSYKRLFSHPKMMKDLLEGFIDEAWVKELDFSCLEAVKSSFVSEDYRRREDDLIWKIRCRDQWLYIYILLEFQSTVDPFMAVRLMTYLGLFYQDLITQENLKVREKLPPVVPIVLYNGSRRWNTPLNINDLIIKTPPGLEKYLPHLQYLLIDENNYHDLVLPFPNLVGALFRIENSQKCRDTTQIIEIIDQEVQNLINWCQEPRDKDLSQDFKNWLLRLILPRNLPDVQVSSILTLQEMRAMLAETIQSWYQEAEKKGRAEGLEEGRAEGLEEGQTRGEIRGKAQFLILLLEQKFGSLKPEHHSLIKQMGLKELQYCLEQVLTAQSVEEILK